MAAQHTPGPWRPCEETMVRVVVADNGRWIADCDFEGPPSESDANARLIAAAPDLLAALEDAAASLDTILGDPRMDAAMLSGDRYGRRKVLEAARAAIAKATAA